MEHTSQAVLNRTSVALGNTDLLFGFRDSATGLRMEFHLPVHRFDLWQGYVEGVTRIYRTYGAESALRIPAVSPESPTPIFAVALDEDDTVVGGWYVNGPLTAVTEAYAPSEFAADPVYATLIAEWISHVIPDGAIELKAGWVDANNPARSQIANAIGRSVSHALRELNATYAFATAAEHATRRWARSGARPLPGIGPTPYPDERYLTHFYYWHAASTVIRSDTEQQELFRHDIVSSLSAVMDSPELRP
ncbi:hypothetical protein [Phytoactinopolyspora limicola]|uniref:hypothetical protein n=1 Tax=Phytoactinopolyspora limicola TaxID=2715536 RepID=UPI00140DA87E|nr:hypothetical protein [Phytoactinopolyspora limicola]